MPDERNFLGRILRSGYGTNLEFSGRLALTRRANLIHLQMTKNGFTVKHFPFFYDLETLKPFTANLPFESIKEV